jgi:hypothetical protein
MWQLAHRWCEYVPRVLEQYPKIFAEMYGLIIAAVQIQMPFTLVRSFTVSSTSSSGDREGWPLVDNLSAADICNATSMSSFSNRIQNQLPVALHYCKRYLVGRYFFSKYRIRKNIMQCDKPLLRPPPNNLGLLNYSYAIVPPKESELPFMGEDSLDPLVPIESTVSLSPLLAKRESFMVCNLVHSVNLAFIHYKQRTCHGTDNAANLNETYTIFNHPSKY